MNKKIKFKIFFFENFLSREILLKLFEKHHLTIETCNICLRSAPTLPLSLDQPVKHLLLDDLIVTGIQKNAHRLITQFFFSFFFSSPSPSSFFFFLINVKTSFVSFFLFKNHLVHTLEISIHIQCMMQHLEKS